MLTGWVLRGFPLTPALSPREREKQAMLTGWVLRGFPLTPALSRGREREKRVMLTGWVWRGLPSPRPSPAGGRGSSEPC